MAKHELHKAVANILVNEFKEKVRLDYACCENVQSRQQLPLYLDKPESRRTQICKVDIIIIADNEVKVIVEIEESGMIPTKICGKYLTSGMAKYYRPSKGIGIKLANPLLFVQVLNSMKIPKKNSAIEEQWNNIKQAVQRIRKIHNRSVNYILLYGRPDKFKEESANRLLKPIRKFLATGSI